MVIFDPKNYIADFVGFKAVYFGSKFFYSIIPGQFGQNNIIQMSSHHPSIIPSLFNHSYVIPAFLAHSDKIISSLCHSIIPHLDIITSFRCHPIIFCSFLHNFIIPSSFQQYTISHFSSHHSCSFYSHSSHSGAIPSS